MTHAGEAATRESTRVGLVGVGNMGNPMAANLIKAGWKVTVFDADEAKTKRFAEANGAGAAASLAALGRGCDVVITMLPDGHVVRRVVLGAAERDDCLVRGLARGSVIIDMSSSAPMGTRALARDLEPYGVALLDAPVSGGVRGAVAGTLAVMIGGEQALAERHDALLAPIGRRFYVGPIGSGHAAKVLNNLVSAAGLAAAAEAVRVGERFGIDPHTLVSVINSSSGRNNSTENKFEQFILNGKFDSGFALGLMAKDCALAVEVAEACGVPAELGHATLELWRKAEQSLGGGSDHTEITRFLNEEKGGSGAESRT
jgi:3-hydroxyisobutyrate dehydrogenase